MVAVLGSFIGPDGLGGAFSNNVDALQTSDWYSHGGVQGVLTGMTTAGVGGQMALDVAAGTALISRRDGSNNVQTMGYVLRNPSTSRVTFGVASASARNDALVAAAIDTTDGSIGAGVTAAGITGSGFYLLAVPGVSGTATARTDAQIATYLGRGGWIRLADVPIASSDTQINTANMVSAADSVPRFDSGAITNAFTASAGWTLNTHWVRRIGRFIYFYILATRTGANINPIGSGNGNLTNTALATWSTARYPILFDAPAINATNGYVITGVASSGTVTVSAVGHDDSLDTGDQIELTGHWVSA